MKLVYLIVLLLSALPLQGAYAFTLSRPPFVIEAVEKDAQIAQRAADVLEDAVREFGFRLPVGDEPIRIVIAESAAAFQHHAGPMAALEVNGIARSWQGLIVVKAPYMSPSQDFRGTLRHELVHVLLYRNSNTDYMPRWMNEGICMMLANEFRWQAAFEVAKLFVGGRLIQYRWLDRALSAPESGMEFGDAYAQSLSMTRHLRDMIGDEKFWAVVLGMKDTPFADALRQYGGIDPTTFWNDYRRSLWVYAFWGAFTPGSVLGFGGVLVVIAWFVKRRSNKRIEDRWEREAVEDALFGQNLVTWDELVDDPDDWKRGRRNEDDPR